EAVPLLLGRETSWAEAQRLAARKQEHYRRLASEGPALVHGVAEFVAGLAGQRVPRAVATSASRHDVEVLLTRSGLRDRFEVVVATDGRSVSRRRRSSSSWISPRPRPDEWPCRAAAAATTCASWPVAATRRSASTSRPRRSPRPASSRRPTTSPPSSSSATSS